MTEDVFQPRVVSAKSCRAAAKLFNYGNIAAILVPFPVLIFWFGASMFLYAMNRHHPNERVGYYTQIAAVRFYAITGFLIVVGTFFPPKILYYLIFWALSAAYLIPVSIRDIIRINKETWMDTVIHDEKTENHD